MCYVLCVVGCVHSVLFIRIVHSVTWLSNACNVHRRETDDWPITSRPKDVLNDSFVCYQDLWEYASSLCFGKITRKYKQGNQQLTTLPYNQYVFTKIIFTHFSFSLLLFFCCFAAPATNCCLFSKLWTFYTFFSLLFS